MTKRTISWLLCLMMVVSLFAGTLTGASAANAGVTIDPPSAIIYQTGDAQFTVSTVLDSLLDRAGSDASFDLDDLVESLKNEGLNVNTLTDMLGDAGFNWDDILGSLTGNGFSMDDIAGALLDRLEGSDLQLEDILGDLTGDESTLTDLLSALKDQGFSSDIFDSIWDLIDSNSGSGSGIGGLIGDLIGRFGQNRTGAKVLSDSEDSDSGSVTSIVAANLKEKLREKYGSLFTGDKEQELDDLFAKIDAATDAAGNISLADAASIILSNENFNLPKTVDVIMGATNGEADYSELVNALRDSTGSDLSMDDVAGAFSDVLGDKIDWGNLAEALKTNLGEGFDAKDFLEAIGSGDTDLSGIADKVSEALGMEEGAIDADAVKDALNEALKDENGFDPDAFAAAMGEGFDSDAFLQSVADKLSEAEGAIDADTVSAAIEAALGEQTEPADLSEVAKALKEAMGDNFSVEKLTEALTEALKGEDGETPALDDIVSAVTDAMGGELTKDDITEMVKGLSDSLGENLNIQDLVGSLADTMGSDLEVSQLLDSLKEALGEDFNPNLEEIVSGLLGEGADLGELVNALKDMDFDTSDISSLLFGGDIKYVWYVRAAKSKQKVSSNTDSNIYSGEQSRTLSVTRTTAPLQREEYYYSCTVTIGHKNGETVSEGDRVSYDSPEAKLTIEPNSKPTETTPTETTDPPVQPTAPVLDNVNHIAYIKGYEDGSVRPYNPITRAEAAVIFYRLLTDESRAFYETSAKVFPDVPTGEWYSKEIATLARANVLRGYDDGNFHPFDFITRAQLAAILNRVTVLVPSESAGTPIYFYDTIGHWAASDIRTASANGWVKGYEDGTFRPDNQVTRAEAMTMINRMLGRNPQILVNTNGMLTFWDNTDTTIWFYIEVQEAANGHDYFRGDDGHELWIRVKNSTDN